MSEATNGWMEYSLEWELGDSDGEVGNEQIVKTLMFS